MKPLRIGEIVTIINDLECSNEPALDHDGEEVQVIAIHRHQMFDDPAAPNGFRLRYFHIVQTKDGSVLACQRHELRSKGDDPAKSVFESLMNRIKNWVMA